MANTAHKPVRVLEIIFKNKEKRPCPSPAVQAGCLDEVQHLVWWEEFQLGSAGQLGASATHSQQIEEYLFVTSPTNLILRTEQPKKILFIFHANLLLYLVKNPHKVAINSGLTNFNLEMCKLLYCQHKNKIW